LDDKGIVSQFITERKMRESVEKGNLSIFSNILMQVNAKRGLENYRIALCPKIKSQTTRTMVIGIDVIPLGRQSIIGLAATSNEHLTKHYTSV
jgi:hypothetical protein